MSAQSLIEGRVCTGCGEWRDSSHFGRSAGYAGGLRSRCNECRRIEHDGPLASEFAAAREAREAGLKRCGGCKEAKPLSEFGSNRSKKDGLASECKACTNARGRAWKEKNHEHHLASVRRWQAENPERVRANGRKARANRRARLRGQFVEDVDPRVVFERDEGVCGICGEPVDRSEMYDVDHVVPLALDGEHSYRNVRLAHVPCNRRRGRKIALELEGRKQ